jgi:hypothetical protein
VQGGMREKVMTGCKLPALLHPGTTAKFALTCARLSASCNAPVPDAHRHTHRQTQAHIHTCDSSNCRPSLLKEATTALAVPLVSFLLDWWLSNTCDTPHTRSRVCQ